MKYISLFAGIGGFDLALNRLGHECVYANEWDKYAGIIYNKRFGSIANDKVGGTRTFTDIDARDIKTVKTEEIPDHDLLVGGFPCQAFSIAGNRRGFDDTRGTLFFEIARILADKKPRLFLLENVKGLLSHDKQNTLHVILKTLDELGYDLQWQVLNSKNFGVPQNRERVFIVGHLRGTSRPEVFPIGKNSNPDIVLPTLTSRYYGGQANGGYIGHKPKQIIGGSQGNRVYDPSGVSTTIASQAGGLGAKTGLYAISSSQRKDHVEIRVKSGEANTVTSSGGSLAKSMNFVAEGMKIRRLTPTECERLQGFPDGWTEGISDTQRYKCLGNAVTVNVVYEIAKRLTNVT